MIFNLAANRIDFGLQVSWGHLRVSHWWTHLLEKVIY